MSEAERATWSAAYDAENEAFAAAGLEGEDLVRWKYQRYVRDYLRCVAGIDDSVGELTAALERLARSPRTPQFRQRRRRLGVRGARRRGGLRK